MSTPYSIARLLKVAGAAAAIALVSSGAGLLLPSIDPPHDGQPATKPESRPISLTQREKPAKKADPDHAEAPARNAEKPTSKKPAPDQDETPPDQPEKNEKTDKAEKSKPAAASAAATESAPANADEALKALEEGNSRWVAAQSKDPNIAPSRRQDLAQNGQKPFATIFTCADSRLPVERLFDRGVGELFVVRVAGNVLGPDAAGTIEYGAEHLHVPLLVVMGHTKCGAVAAATAAGDKPGGNVGQLVEKIAPAVARAKQQNPDLDEKQLAAAAVKENVWQTIFDLIRTSGPTRHLVQEGKLKIVGAVCDIATGKVEWYGEHPWQDALVQAFEAKNAKQSSTTDAEDHK